MGINTENKYAKNLVMQKIELGVSQITELASGPKSNDAGVQLTPEERAAMLELNVTEKELKNLNTDHIRKYINWAAQNAASQVPEEPELSVEGGYEPMMWHMVGEKAYHNNFGHDWLNGSADFFQKFAQKIVDGSFNLDWDKDGEEFYRLTQTFAERALEFFGGYSVGYQEGYNERSDTYSRVLVFNHTSREETLALAEQFKTAIFEMAENIKSGKGAGFSELKTKINIKDFEMSMGDMVDIQQAMQEITSPLDASYDTASFAELGLSMAAVKQFAQSRLSPELGDKLVKLYEKRIQNEMDRRTKEQLDMGMVMNSVKGTQENYYNNHLQSITDDNNINSATYRKFASVEISSKTALDAAYDWLNKELDSLGSWRGMALGTKPKMMSELSNIIDVMFDTVNKNNWDSKPKNETIASRQIEKNDSNAQIARKYNEHIEDYRNDLGHDWLYNSTDFIERMAKSLSEYGFTDDNADRTIYVFAERMLEYFGGHGREYDYDTNGKMLFIDVHNSEETIQNVANQIKQSITEIAANHKKTGVYSIYSSQSKISFEGMEMTLGEIVSTQQKIAQVMDAMQPGGAYSRKAQMGMAVAAINKYATENFEKNTAEKLTNTFASNIEKAMVRSNHSPALEKVRAAVNAVSSSGSGYFANGVSVDAMVAANQAKYDYYRMYNDDLSMNTLEGDIYRKFSGVSTDGNESFIDSFNQVMDWYAKEMRANYDFNGYKESNKDKYISQDRDVLYRMFDLIF